ncbi:transposable element Tcb1 transposase [Trichonephila clavipes]|nr:transposable element Tcb1 transposase [Trichonephila clavipes]
MTPCRVPQNSISVTTRTIRRCLQQSGLSARRTLLCLPFTQNHRRLRRQWCDERSMWVAEWNEVVFTDESSICLQHHDCRIRVWRHRGERMLNSCVMYRHTGPAPGIMEWKGPLTPAKRNGQFSPLWDRVEVPKPPAQGSASWKRG